ncbi:hypothetical protein Pyn_36861 [Prunus yedoensis var. nudiflora]|uniref:Uncharacterized protein n=1 Tax=Prunus yedoensis var. nudiflora TaxID=2094558 RepID=A0A315B4T7_PRUYE|nr:hypothetical protein Pyn_36861 [Prunus yedoensis var. nudiflora]
MGEKGKFPSEAAAGRSLELPKISDFVGLGRADFYHHEIDRSFNRVTVKLPKTAKITQSSPPNLLRTSLPFH